MSELTTTKGKWYDLIATGTKKMDFRKGIREIQENAPLRFNEASKKGIPTGRYANAETSLVIHSVDFPKHFGWDGPDFTLIQFDVLDLFPKTCTSVHCSEFKMLQELKSSCYAIPDRCAYCSRYYPDQFRRTR